MKPKFKIKVLVTCLTTVVAMTFLFALVLAINFELDAAFAISFVSAVLLGVKAWYYVDDAIRLHTKNRKVMWASKANGNKLRRELCEYCGEDDYCEVVYMDKPFCSKTCAKSYKSEE